MPRSEKVTGIGAESLRPSHPVSPSTVSPFLVSGLEVLLAGDIIHIVDVTQTLESVSRHRLIRWFLGITLKLEIEGRWPW